MALSPERLARSYTSLARAILRFPEAPWEDAVSHGQMQSKAWAIRQLIDIDSDLGLVYLLGGWLGMLPLLMLEEPRLKFRKIRSFDRDPACEPIADQVNIENVMTAWRFKAITKDMFDVHYDTDHRYEINVKDQEHPSQVVETCDTIINTCCDHVDDFARWWSLIPDGKLVLLQNNNFEHGQDHVNTVADLSSMRAQAPMAHLMFSGTLELVKYQRFMLIGIK